MTAPAATTVAGMLAKKSKAPNLRVDVEAFVRPKAWTLTSGKTITYETPFTQDTRYYPFRTVDSVEVTDRRTNPSAPVALVSRASTALVEANPGSYFHDTAAAKLHISTPESDSPGPYVVRVGFWQYYTDGHAVDARAIRDASLNTYYPIVYSVPEQRKSLTDLFYGTMVTGTDEVVLANASGGLDAAFNQWEWETGRVNVYYGGEDITTANYAAGFSGRCVSRQLTPTTITLSCRDNTDRLDKKANAVWTDEDWRRAIEWTPMDRIPGTFANQVGTFVSSMSGFKGNEYSPEFQALIGSSKPLAYGPVTNATPTILLRSSFKRHSTTLGIIVVALEGRRIKSIVDVTVDTLTYTPTTTSPAQFATWYNLEYGLVWIESKSTGSPVDPTTATVTISFEGRTDDGDELIYDFPSIVEDMTTNVIPDATFDQDALDLSRLHCEPLTPRIYETADTTLRAVLNTVCASTLGQFWVSDSGPFMFTVYSPTLVGEVQIKDTTGDCGEITLASDPSRLLSTIVVGWKTNEDDETAYHFETRAESVAFIDDTNVFTVDTTYLGDRDSAVVTATRLARLASRPSLNATTEFNTTLFASDLLTTFWMEEAQLPGITTNTRHHFMLVSLNRDYDSFCAIVTLQDRRVEGTQGYLNDDGTLGWSAATDEEKNSAGFFADTFGFADATDTESFGTAEYW